MPTARTRTAGEAGWHASRYNLLAPIPDSKLTAAANLFRGSCCECNPLELYLLSVVEELDEGHPIIERLAARGLICDFDERAALESMGRAACAAPQRIDLTICPTMGCNFDCPYCFERHRGGTMAAEVQDDVVALAGRLIDASGTRGMHVTWFGGEPLLAPEVIERLSARLMELAGERGVSYSAGIITNGYLLDQGNADLLARCGIRGADVTLDGLGPAHDATRHLAGGGPTFERIARNLHDTEIPFAVAIRHNVHEGNRGQMEALEAFIGELAAASGNRLSCYPAVVIGNDAASERRGRLDLLCARDASATAIRQETERFEPGRGHHCSAHSLWNVGVDEQGNLYKCWEASGDAAFGFGTAHDWDPADPLSTAAKPDNLTKYLNTAGPVPDDECRGCTWLPLCVGGCPHQRLSGQRACVPFRDDPQAYVLALHARMVGGKSE